MNNIDYQLAKKKLFSFLLSEKLKERVKVVAAYRGRTMATFINEAIENHVDLWEKKNNEGN